jgi:hypothetical protein
MNRKVYAIILASCTCVALGFLAGCGGSSSLVANNNNTS